MNDLQHQGHWGQCQSRLILYYFFIITPTGSNTVIYSKNIHSKKHTTHKISYQSETESSPWKSVSVYCTTKDFFGMISYWSSTVNMSPSSTLFTLQDIDTDLLKLYEVMWPWIHHLMVFYHAYDRASSSAARPVTVSTVTRRSLCI